MSHDRAEKILTLRGFRLLLSQIHWTEANEGHEGRGCQKQWVVS